jgi:hypothetical protein
MGEERRGKGTDVKGGEREEERSGKVGERNGGEERYFAVCNTPTLKPLASPLFVNMYNFLNSSPKSLRNLICKHLPH